MSLPVLYYSETFCSLSETFVYREAMCLERYHPLILTHHRMNAEQYPAEGLNIVEWPRPAYGKALRGIHFARNWLVHGLRASDIVSPRRMLSLRARHPFQLIFAHFGLLGIRMLPAARALGCPLVVHFHGCDVTNWCRHANYLKNLRVLFERGNAFVAPSEYIREKLSTLGCPMEKCHVIHLPIPLEGPLPDKPGELRPIRFLHVGRLVEKKGILHTLQAFKAAVSDDLPLELVVAGDGPQRAEAERLSQELNVDDKVRFLGSVRYDRVRAEMQAADVLVLHSVTASDGDTEGLPIVIGEAMAMGLPVISTHHAGIPEIIRDGATGFLVSERDEAAQTRAMLLLARDPALRSQMGKAGHERIEREFSFANTRCHLERLFDTLLNVRPA
jgi:glycosyltransferase involved in cell wall biosynthesis